MTVSRRHRYHATRNNNISNLNGACHAATVRGNDDIDDKNIEEASACQKNIRHMLNDEVFKIMARWTKKARDEGKMHDACVLHAHLAF